MRLCGVEAMGLGIQVVLNFLEIAIRFTIIQKVKIIYFIDNLSLILVATMKMSNFDDGRWQGDL